MSKEHTCCVTGHRNVPAGTKETIWAELRRELLSAIEDGYIHFISGFATGADLMFAEIVTELKKDHAITLEAAIPYPERMKTPDAGFQRLIGCCDVVKVHSERYFKGCFMRRNRYMADASQRVIAVYDGRETGGTAATVRYAMRKDLQICIINPKLAK